MQNIDIMKKTRNELAKFETFVCLAFISKYPSKYHDQIIALIK